MDRSEAIANRMKAAEQLAKTEKWEEALAEYQSIARDFAGIGEAERAIRQAREIDECRRWIKMGDSYVEAGNPDGAMKWYQKVLDSYPDGLFVEDARRGLRIAERFARFPK